MLPFGGIARFYNYKTAAPLIQNLRGHTIASHQFLQLKPPQISVYFVVVTSSSLVRYFTILMNHDDTFGRPATDLSG